MKHLEISLGNQNQWWKYLLVFLGGFLGANIIGSIPLLIVIITKAVQNGINPATLQDNPMDFSAYGIDPNFGLILLMIPFILGLVAIVFLIKAVHNRKFSEVVNGRNKIRWKKFAYAAAFWGFIMAAYLVIDYNLSPDNYILSFNISSFIPLIIISIVLIPLQTTFEETLFRGYLAQGVAGLTKNRWLALIIPTVVFMLMHSANPEVKEYGFLVVMPQYMIFGLLFGLVSILDDGIELAMGAHAMNNVFSSIFITSKASVLQTDALFEQINVYPKKETGLLLLFSILFIALMAFSYKWDFSILNRKVEKGDESEN